MAKHNFPFGNGKVGHGTGRFKHCFLEGTNISMSDGTNKNIEDIKVGDLVKTYDVKKNIVSDSKVNEVMVHDGNPEGIMLNGLIKTTINHHFYSTNRVGCGCGDQDCINKNNWIAAGNLKIGDTILNLEGESVVINSIEPITTTNTVYNFEVDGTHNYFADSLLAHNHTGKRRGGKRRRRGGPRPNAPVHPHPHPHPQSSCPEGHTCPDGTCPPCNGGFPKHAYSRGGSTNFNYRGVQKNRARGMGHIGGGDVVQSQCMVNCIMDNGWGFLDACACHCDMGCHGTRRRRGGPRPN